MPLLVSQAKLKLFAAELASICAILLAVLLLLLVCTVSGTAGLEISGDLCKHDSRVCMFALASPIWHAVDAL